MKQKARINEIMLIAIRGPNARRTCIDLISLFALEITWPDCVLSK
tara:strand:+ start:755 stop:889 length:135 start_codon:yes stop_codon:yes gene_type:complete